MGISFSQLLIIVLIVALLFGTKRLRSLGTDLGEAIKGFKKSIKDEDPQNKQTSQPSESVSQDSIAQNQNTQNVQSSNHNETDKQPK